MDNFCLENRDLLDESDLEYLCDTNVNVYLDKELVFSGSLDLFLQNNQYDFYLVEKALELRVRNTVSFSEHSGFWELEVI